MAINNPYVPGDPYSYDLKWIVSHIKDLEDIYNNVDGIIASQIYKAFQESNLINFKTVDDMMEKTLEPGAVVLCDGYHSAGDGGTMIYFIQGFTPEMCQLNYYIELPGNMIAVPVILFPYVCPVMFGAYADGVADDTAAVQQAVMYGMPVNLIGKTYLITDTIDVDLDGLSITNGVLKMDTEAEHGFLNISGAEYVTVRDVIFTGSGDTMPTGSYGAYTALQADHADHLTVDNCRITKVSNGGIFVTNSSYVTVTSNEIDTIANNDAYGSIVVGYAINDSDMGYQTIQNNTIDGGHFGIEVQGWQHDVNISNNKTKNNYGYGIALYRMSSDPSDISENFQVIGNLVENTHHNPNVGYYCGMGIYVQTINKVTVSDNILNNIMLDRPDAASPNRTLSPGAISISGSEEVTCTGNVINGSVIDGIDVVDVSSTTIGNIISNNVITDASVQSIHAQAVQNALFSGNIISGTSYSAIEVLSHPTKETKNLTFNGNIIRSNSDYSLSVTKGTGTKSEGIVVTNNMLTNHTVRGFTFSNIDNLVVSGNMITADAAVSNYAAYFSSVTEAAITGNVINGTSANYYTGGYYFNNVNESTFTGNVTKGVATANAMYSKASSDITIGQSVDDLHTIPFTEGFEMHYSRTVAAPHFFSENMTPASGTHARGSIAFNTVPAAGQPIFWVCTAAGTPGTWVPGPTL